jgi:hypothetical protein
METITGWRARRAGAAITIVHATGRITGIDRIEPRQLEMGTNAPKADIIVAVRGDGKNIGWRDGRVRPLRQHPVAGRPRR